MAAGTWTGSWPWPTTVGSRAVSIRRRVRYRRAVARPDVGASFGGGQSSDAVTVNDHIGLRADVHAVLSPADRERLLTTVSGAEEWLMAKVLAYAHALGFTAYTSTLLEAWRMSIEGLTRSIVLTTHEHAQVPELGPDDDYGSDPAAAFGIVEARAHRKRGVNLAMFIALFKYYRQAYRRLLTDPVMCPEPFDDADAVATYLERVFDRLELGYATAWAGTSAETQIRELSEANRVATNEKTKVLTLIESLPIPALLVNEQRDLDMMNFAAAQLFLGDRAIPGQMYYQPDLERVAFPQWLGGILDAVDARGTQPPGEPDEVVVDRATAGRRTLRVYVERMLDISAKFAGYAVLLVDVTRERADAVALREAAAVFQDSTNAIVVTDPHGVVRAVNPALATLLGTNADAALGSDVTQLLGCSEELWPRALEPTGTFWADRRWYGEATLRTSAGEQVPGWLTLSSVNNAAGDVDRIIGVFTDVSSLKASEERFEHLSNHDPLTGLLNRVGVRGELDDALHRARRRQRSVGVFFLDLDRFKEINDSRGHSVGDLVLQEIGQRLQAALRSDDILGRIGGDEFLAVVSGIRGESELGVVAGKILSCLREPVHAEDDAFEITGSVGIALYPSDGETSEVLIRNADAAMYRAKALGQDQYAVYTAELTERASQRLELETELRGAIRSGTGLTLAYQPVFELRSGSPVAVEALLRWSHDQLGNVPPSVFVPVAEDIGLMPKLGTWVLTEALAQLNRWRSAGLYVPQMCVNASPTQIERAEFLQELSQALEDAHVGADQLVLEVTEEALFLAHNNGVRALRRIRELGVQVAIDDFGQGYSSLSRLRTLPVDIVKIDRAFIGGLDGALDARHRRAVAQAITDLLHAFGKTIVAEGVEDCATADYLRTAHCELAQGFLYARPLAPTDLAQQWSALTALPAASSMPGRQLAGTDRGR